MISRKEEERNEKIIRGLMKLPPNRRCINCDSLGPQYVCTNFWTFVCITCSGIHREFTHRVKSVSMSKFTTQEVQALERGGNQRAREAFLKDWDMQNKRFPSNSNPDRIREFIKDVYVDKKYARGMSSHKPPKDAQNHRNFDEDRRASSYHSFSQSPPYDHQYEERFYGKPSGIQARRTGSERLSYNGRLPIVVYSPGHMEDQFSEERFANEGSGTRYSDFSASSAGETVRYDVQSPNFQKGTGNSSPHSQVVRAVLIEDVNVKKDAIKSQHQSRSTSSSSFGSSNSISVKSVSSSSLSEQSSGIQMMEGTTPSFLPQSSAKKVSQQQNRFSLFSVDHLVTKSTPQLIDLFSEVNQTSPASSSTHNTDHAPFPENKGWAMFDMPQHSLSTVEQTSTSHITRDQTSGVNVNVHSTGNDISNWLPVQSSVENNRVASVNAHWSLDSHKATTPFTQSNTQFLNEFEYSSGNSNRTIENLALKTNSEVFADEPQALVNPYSGLNLPEGSIKFDFHGMTVGGGTSVHSMPFGYDVEPGIPFPNLPLHEERTLERKSTNPFDFPYEADLGNGRTLDMRSLQGSLPNPQNQIPFQNNIPQLQCPENPMPSYVSPLSGGLPYMAAQQPNSQLTTLSSQSYIGSSKGNPFA